MVFRGEPVDHLNPPVRARVVPNIPKLFQEFVLQCCQEAASASPIMSHDGSSLVPDRMLNEGGYRPFELQYIKRIWEVDCIPASLLHFGENKGADLHFSL